MPRVDIAVPCYQYGQYLRECVTSVLTQDIQDLRILIIDNASTDNSLEVARELAAEDARVQVVAHPTNLGHHASFNEGIDWAISDYFMVLCADDLLAPRCLSRAVSMMEKCPAVHLTYGRECHLASNDSIHTIDQSRQEPQWRVLLGPELLERLCLAGRCLIPGQTVVVRTSAQKRVGYYRSTLTHTDDFEMWMRFASLGAVAETQAIQGIRRVHPLNRCSSIRNVHMWDLHFEAAFESFFANEGSSAIWAKRLHRVARRALSERAYWGAVANLLRGDVDLSLDLLGFAFSRCPSTMIMPPVSYLFHRDDAFRHIASVVSQAASRVYAPASVGQANH